MPNTNRDDLVAGVDYIGVGVGAVVISSNGYVLLSQRGLGARNEHFKLECPGGGAERNEPLIDTVVRELQEELGIEVEVVELLGYTDHILEDEGQHWVSLHFLCRHVRGVPHVREIDKCLGVGFFSLDEAEKLDLTQATRQCLRDLRRRNPGGLYSR